MNLTYLNGEYIDSSNAKISIQDRGFRFGDGIFETLRIKNSQTPDLPLHLKRLTAGLDALKIKADLSELENICHELIAKNKQISGFIRIIVTRGVGSRGYLPLDSNQATMIVESFAEPKMSNHDYNLVISKYLRTDSKSLPIQYKLMQGLNSTLAKLEAKELGYDDALLLNSANYISETSSANIFFMENGKLFTPDLENGILAGIAREKIAKRFSVEELSLKLEDLKNFDLSFITNIALATRNINQVSQNKNIIWQSNPTEKSLEIFKDITEFLS